MRWLPFIALVLASTVAHAEPTVTPLARTCAEVAEDGLDPETRARAQELLVHVLERADLFVVDRDCEEVYRIQHAPHGDRVMLVGPGARVSATAPDRNQLGAVYADLLDRQRAARAQALAKPPEAAPQPDDEHVSVAPPEVAVIDTPQTETAPDVDAQPTATIEPARRHSLYYGRAGLGGVHLSEGGGSGPAFGFGVRLPARAAMFDLSLDWIGGTTGFAAKTEILSLPDIGKAGAAYVGAGMSASHVSTFAYTGGGLAGELSAGLTLSPSHHAFAQADLTLPFYMAGDAYPVMFALSVGFGFEGR